MIGGGACAYPAFQIRLERRVERWRKGTPFAAEGIGKESLPRRIAKRNEPRIFTRWLAQAQGKIEAALRRIDAEKADGKVAPSGATFTVSPSCTACRTVAMPSPKGGSAAFAKVPSRVLRMARGMCPRCSDPGAAISIFVRRQQVSLLQLLQLSISKRGKTGGGMNLRFTGGHELDLFWECCRPPTSMAYRTPI